MVSSRRSLKEAQLIRELAILTGRTEDQIVIDALRRELAAVRATTRRPAAEQILEGAERVRRHLRLPLVNHGELLYDENGLPK